MATRSSGNRRKGHLVTTVDGWVEYAVDTGLQEYGPATGARVLTKDLDAPGKDDLPPLVLPDDVGQVEPMTDSVNKPRQTYATDGTGIPLDSDGDKMF